ncbi:MAG: hypothetical protein ABF593_05905, partial [Acetobacter papayae]|uniref:hypothetical protein n=1 Tax=Acetobacter papayae TaxID=1076592 RepID=UPI0039EC13E3
VGGRAGSSVLTAPGRWTTDGGLAAARTAWRNVLCGGKNGKAACTRSGAIARKLGGESIP